MTTRASAKIGCQGCRGSGALPFEFTMAFQPIVHLGRGRVWGYEALVRGTEGQTAGWVLDQVNETNRYNFDQACRVKAIEFAGTLFPVNDDVRLSINFMPNAVYEPAACIKSSLQAASRVGFDPERIMFEFTENEHMSDPKHVGRIIEEYKRIGFTTALDDFGAGYAGLSLLADFQPDLVKIDMNIIRGITVSSARQAILSGIMTIARELKLSIIAEGIECEDELRYLQGSGIELFQGYYFAKPLTGALPTVTLPADGARAAA